MFGGEERGEKVKGMNGCMDEMIITQYLSTWWFQVEDGWMYGWEERGGHSQALLDGFRLENTWLDGWDERGGHLLALHDNLGFENTQLNGCMYGWDERGGHLLALHDNLGFENTQLDGCMDEMRGVVTH